ncbi:MAG: histidinol-phosphate transaminase [Mariprofundaceae bacterium]
MRDMNWQAYAVPQSRVLHPYVPGKPVEQLLLEKGLTSALKLASNENPYGPPPASIEAIRRVADKVHLYPDGSGSSLKSALAEKLGVTREQILLGNGSNEVLELLIRCFAGAGDEVVYSQHAFIVYALSSIAAGACGTPAPENDGFSHDLDALYKAVGPRTRLICMANPNNPTGTLLSLDSIQGFLDRLPRQMVVLLDEAYFEYVQETIGDSMKYLEHPGLLICRTFSKAYGLAGCRVGYAVGDSEIIELANRFREPFNVNSIALIAAEAALQDERWVLDHVNECLCERQRLEQFFRHRDCLSRESHGNFVLLRHNRAKEILLRLEDCGIISRSLEPYGLADILRISVGKPSENDRLMAELEPILTEFEA